MAEMLITVLGLVIAGLGLLGLSDFLKTHGIHKITYRFVAGHPLNGDQEAGRLPRHRRALIRLTCTFVLGGWGYGLITAMQITIISMLITGLSLIIAGLVLLIRAGRKHYRNKTLINPLAQALSKIIELSTWETERAISLEPDYLTKDKGEIGAVILPAEFLANPAQRQSTEFLITSRLPVDVDFRWKTATNPQSVRLLAAPKPPKLVSFKDFVAEIEACGKGEYILGIDRHKNLFKASFNIDNAHHAYSLNTGRGKSTLLKSVAAQVLHNHPDNRVTVIDPKMVSLMSLTGVPGIEIACDPSNIQDMWDKIYGVKALLDRRLRELKADPTKEFPLHILMLEEGNTFAVMSKTHWQQTKEPGVPATPPIWAEAIAPILWQGRQVSIHVVGVFQNMLEKYLGGMSLRPMFGLIGLSGYRPNQWITMIGTHPVPRSQKGQGRIIMSDGENETWIQALYGNDIELRDWATSKHQAPELVGAESGTK